LLHCCLPIQFEMACGREISINIRNFPLYNPVHFREIFIIFDYCSFLITY